MKLPQSDLPRTKVVAKLPFAQIKSRLIRWLDRGQIVEWRFLANLFLFFMNLNIYLLKFDYNPRKLVIRWFEAFYHLFFLFDCFFPLIMLFL